MCLPLKKNYIILYWTVKIRESSEKDDFLFSLLTTTHYNMYGYNLRHVCIFFYFLVLKYARVYIIECEGGGGYTGSIVPPSSLCAMLLRCNFLLIVFDFVHSQILFTTYVVVVSHGTA